jgi:hypothetical protein
MQARPSQRPQQPTPPLQLLIAQLRSVPDAEELLLAHARFMRTPHVCQFIAQLPFLEVAACDNGAQRVRALLRCAVCGVVTSILLQHVSFLNKLHFSMSLGGGEAVQSPIHGALVLRAHSLRSHLFIRGLWV